jgi:hypothetical protein
MRRVLVASAVLGVSFLAGCSIVGGGIAGAGYDPIWQVKSAEAYRPLVSPMVAETVTPNAAGERPQPHTGDMMRTFPAQVESLGEETVSIPGSSLSARYDKRVFALHNKGALVLSQELPAVFDVRPVRLGYGVFSGCPVVMIVNRSRSSTGLCFVGLYTARGGALYTAVLKGSDVWDVRASGDTIDILGARRVRRIAFRPESFR